MRTRDEHLAWCKARALEYLDDGDWKLAAASMMSDLRLHEETQDAAETAVKLFPLALLCMRQGDIGGLRRWITGFN